jgi:hypothetical protein
MVDWSRVGVLAMVAVAVGALLVVFDMMMVVVVGTADKKK